MTPTVAGPIDSYVIAKLDTILLFVINYHRNIKILSIAHLTSSMLITDYVEY